MKTDTKNALYVFVKKADDLLRGSADLLNVISSVWDVYKRSSTGEDRRYKILGDEIEKHHIMNDDWPQDKLYLSILNLMDNEDNLLKFVCELMNLKQVRANEELMQDLRNALNDEGLDIIEYKNNLSIGEKPHFTSARCKNDIPFVLCKSTIDHYVDFKESNIQLPEDEKCFVVTFNDQWNDYGWETWFRIYYKEGSQLQPVGSVKIMKGNEDSTLPARFYCLSNEYCSLGYNIEYYKNSYQLFGEKAIDFLALLQDASINTTIQDNNADMPAFKQSLIRDNCSERALREGRFYANGKEMDNAYSFIYSYAPPYYDTDDNAVNIPFDFVYSCPSFKRAIGMIGENGVGKSTLLRNLSHGIACKEKKNFAGKTPIFSKVMVLSFSPFDVYPTSYDDNVIEYRYCGLMKSKNELLSQEEQIEKFKENLMYIIEALLQFS